MAQKSKDLICAFKQSKQTKTTAKMFWLIPTVVTTERKHQLSESTTASRGPILLLKLCFCKFWEMKRNIRLIIRALREETAVEVEGTD